MPTTPEGLTRTEGGWLKRKLLDWLNVVPPVLADVEESPSTARQSGFDHNTSSIHDYLNRGRVSYRDELIGLPFLPRSRRITLSRALYDQDPRYSDIIKKVSQECFKGGFEFKIRDGVPESLGNTLLAAIDDLSYRTNYRKDMRGWHKSALVDGDLFLQIVLAGESQVSRIAYLNPLTMQRNSSAKDMFPDTQRAFIEFHDGTISEDDGTLTELVEFNPVRVRDAEERIRSIYNAMEVWHARVDELPGRRYGRPLLEGGLDSARFARVGELDIAIRRKLKSAPRDVWTVGDQNNANPPDSVLLDVMDDIERKRHNVERGRELDMVVKYPVSTERFSGDATVGVTDDIKHHIDSLYAAGPIPKQASGFFDDINRDVVPAVRSVLSDNIRTEREWLRDHLLIPVMERMLLFEGVPVVPGAMIDVEFAPQEFSLEDFATVSTALAALGRVGLTTTASTGRLLARMMPEVFDADEYERERMEDAEKQAAMSESMETEMSDVLGDEDA